MTTINDKIITSDKEASISAIFEAAMNDTINLLRY